nr:flagellin [Caulobacter mirabilis]
MSSINTNRAALQALRALNAAADQLRASETRIATGLRIAGPKDDGATFSIAQGMRAEVSGWQVVGQGLARGQSILDVAYAGAERISDLLVGLKERAVAYNDATLDTVAKAAIRSEMEAITRQIDQIAKGTDFDGVNLLTGRATINTRTETTYLTTLKQPLRVFNDRMSALPEGSTHATSTSEGYSLPTSPLTPPSFAAAVAAASGTNSQTIAVDAGPTGGRISLLLDAYGAPDIVEIWQNGTRVAATGQAYAPGGGAVGPGAAVSNQHLLSFDYDPADGQTIEFRFNENVSVSGTAWKLSGAVLQDPADPPPARQTTVSTVIGTSAEFDPPLPSADPEQVGRALGVRPQGSSSTYTLDAGGQAGRMDMTFDAFGDADRVEIWQGGVRVAASGQAYAAGGGAVGPAAAVSGRQTISFDYDPAGGPLSFRFNEGGGTPESAWVVSSLSLNAANAPLPATAAGTSGRQEPGFGLIHYDFLANPRGDSHLRASSRDLTAAGLRLDALNWDTPETILATIDVAGKLAIQAATYFGERLAGFNRTGAQTGRMSDVVQTGVGNLVDADLAKEGARLQALQVQQRLAAQSLTIANAAPQWLLSLYRGSGG